MDDSDDQLLASYVSAGSHAAFAELVRRHIDLVYAAARRQVHDPHLAEDVTQSVFILLTQKARSVRAGSLPAWLLRTTRFACRNAVKVRGRRRRHERLAAAARSEGPHDEEPMHDEIAALLDDGLARLGRRDRTAVAMHYLQGKGTPDVAAALGVTEHAARRRLSRAVAKLRDSFARRGITASGEALIAGMTSQAARFAPAALVATVTDVAGTMTSAAAPAVIAKATLKTMARVQAKVVACFCGAVLLVAGGVVAVAQSEAPAVAAAPEHAPAAAPAPGQFANADLKTLLNREQYATTLDANVRRTTEPAALFQNTAPRAVTYGSAGFMVPVGPYKEKRVRVTAHVKTQDVAGWAGLAVEVYGVGYRVHAFDMMSDRPIHGTTGWTQYSSVVDVPADTLSLIVGVVLYGSGKVWVDGFEVTPVGVDVPCTDDQNWHTWSPKSHLYGAVLDPATRRNGHPTTRVSSVDAGFADYGIYDYGDRHIEQYLGRRIRVTAWLKGERVTGGSGLSIHVNGAAFRQIANEGQKGHRPLAGTKDWQKYEAVADVPAEAQSIFRGITLNGRGTIWIDDVQTEVIDTPK